MSNIMTDLCVGVSGRFKIEAFRTDDAGNEIPGTRRVAADWFNNLITDAGLNLIGSGGRVGNLNSNTGPWCTCGVGSGSTAPSASDTALQAQVARSNTWQSTQSGTQGSAPYFGWKRQTYRFATGVAAGNLSEVGMFSAMSGGTCFSRALILDGGGSPTTITVLSDETLDVTYELRLYPAADSTWSATIQGVSYSGNVRAALVTQGSYMGFWSPGEGQDQGASGGLLINTNVGGAAITAYETQTLGAVTGVPSGTAFPASLGATPATYTPGNFYRDHAVVWGLSDGNAPGGIGSMRILSVLGTYQMNFTPKLPKDSTKVLTLNVRVSWARRTP